VRASDGEVVIQTTFDASWLPRGGRAEVIRGGVPPQPMSLVRLLLRRGDRVFCTPRNQTGKLDLPTRATEPDDVHGSRSIAVLVEEVLGRSHRSEYVGAVRNVVTSTSAAYDPPTPLAHFGVWRSDGDPLIDGVWIGIDGDSPLRDRHWYALISGGEPG
jgi:hypothetical protein